MKLTTAQKAVFSAGAAMFLLILADVANITEIPNLLIVVGSLAVGIAGHFILPSLNDLMHENRRP